MTTARGIELLVEIGAFGRVLSDAVADVGGSDLSHNVPVVILGSLELDGPQRPTQLMARTGLSSGGMTKAIDRLELNGLVVRAPDSRDGRAFLVRITSDGSRVLARMAESLDAAMESHPDLVDRFKRVVAGI